MHLTKNDTNLIKGVAILLMLVHHLFGCPAGEYSDVSIMGFPLVRTIGDVGKICVSLFVFLSGYGLAKQVQDKTLELKNFYVLRFTKLYLNFWLVVIIFVPLGVFVFDRSLEEAYGLEIMPNMLLDFFGLLSVTGKYGYNPTWWFYSCIIILYLAFPLFYKLMIKVPVLLVLLVGILDYGIISPLGVISSYVTSFVLGMFVTQIKVTDDNISSKKRALLCIGVLLCLLMLIRIRVMANVGLKYDALISIALIYFLKLLSIPHWISLAFSALGRHSANIFLTHTFFYLFFFSEFIYSDPNPLVILLKLLAICIPVSMLLECIKGLPLLNVVFRRKRVLD